MGDLLKFRQKILQDKTLKLKKKNSVHCDVTNYPFLNSLVDHLRPFLFFNILLIIIECNDCYLVDFAYKLYSYF